MSDTATSEDTKFYSGDRVRRWAGSISSERVLRALDDVQGELGASSASWQRWVLHVTEMSCNLRSDGGLLPSHFKPTPEWHSESRNEAGERELRDPWGLFPSPVLDRSPARGRVGHFFRAGVWSPGKAPTRSGGQREREVFLAKKRAADVAGHRKANERCLAFDCQAATLQRCMSFCGSCTIAGAGTVCADGQPSVLIRRHGATLYPSSRSTSGGRHKAAAHLPILCLSPGLSLAYYVKPQKSCLSHIRANLLEESRRLSGRKGKKKLPS